MIRVVVRRGLPSEPMASSTPQVPDEILNWYELRLEFAGTYL